MNLILRSTNQHALAADVFATEREPISRSAPVSAKKNERTDHGGIDLRCLAANRSGEADLAAASSRIVAVRTKIKRP
jgi:hypothetical protein